MGDSVRTRALQRAVELYGVRGLAQKLNVSRIRIDVWLRGDMPVPGHVFLAAVDMLLAHDLAELERNAARPKRDADVITETDTQRKPGRPDLTTG